MKKRGPITLLVISLSAGFLLGLLGSDEVTDYHRAYHSTKEFYENAHARIPNDITSEINKRGLIVNHHLLADVQVAEAFSSVRNENPRLIVLIGPNHFARGRADAITTNLEWQTPYGKLRPNYKYIEKLTSGSIIIVDHKPFELEHSIYNLVGFVKREFPDADFFPLILKDSLSEDKRKEIVTGMLNAFPDDTLYIASIDFAHGVSPQEARIDDAKSLETIRNFDFNEIQNLNIDSKSSLKVILSLMRSQDANNFELLRMSNAGELLGKPDLEDTTGYITGYFTD